MMPLNIQAKGTRQAVAKHIQELKAAEGADAADKAFFENSRTFILAQIDEMPNEFNSVHVVANGQVVKGKCEFQTVIVPLNLHI